MTALGLSQEALTRKWVHIAARLKAELGEDLYSSWFTRMEPVQLVGDCLVVSVPTRFLRNWIETHYTDRLLTACRFSFDGLKAVAVRVRPRGKPRSAMLETSVVEKSAPAPSSVQTRTVHVKTGGQANSPLDRGLTFGSFIVGDSNALAHAAAMRVAEAPPGAPLSFNPLFIHSNAGLGKTHLLNAISWRIRDRRPERKTMFVTAERFMYHFMAALKNKDTLSFKNRFQGVDVLLIDDFQFLQGKTMLQEFCHTFNSLVDAKRQVVIAADMPPAKLDSIDQRMRSRLGGGLVVDIQNPDYHLRCAILRARLLLARSKEPSIAISEEVIEFVANKIRGGGRELEGALNRLVASQQLTRAPMTLDLAVASLKDLVEAGDGVNVRIDDILKAVGRHYNVARTDLLSPRRARSIVIPRQIGMYLAKKLTPRSLPEIGRRFGGRDHSTVLHAIRKIDGMLKTDENLSREVDLLTRLIESE